MTKAEEFAERMIDKLYAARRGHGSTAGIVERHLRRSEMREIVKMAYEQGFTDCLTRGHHHKHEGPTIAQMCDGSLGHKHCSCPKSKVKQP